MIKIGIDITDTIIDVWPILMDEADRYNRLYVNNEKISNQSNIYLPELIYNWSLEDTNNFWMNYGYKILFYAPLKDGVKETLDYFKQLKILLYFISAKRNSGYEDLKQDIENILLKYQLPYDGIYTEISRKGKFCREKNIDFLIDDSYDNCLDAVKNDVVGILISNDYNIDRKIVENMYRIDNFNEAKEIIKNKVGRF